MMTMRQFFYDTDPEPIWQSDTAASQQIRYPTAGIQQMRPAAPPPVMKPPVTVVRESPRGPPPVVVHREQARAPPPMVQVVVPPALQYRVIELRVPLCCEGCQDRVVKKMKRLIGVDYVHCDLTRQKVTVKGYAQPMDVLMQCKKLFSRSEFWTREAVKVVVLDKPQRPARELV